MKKNLTFLCLPILLLVLAARQGATAPDNTSSTTGNGSEANQNTSNPGGFPFNGTPSPGGGLSQTLPIEGQLLVGTFKLEDTQLAITHDQAVTLLPLWQAVKVMVTSTTTAPEELSALYAQIQSTLTTDQMAAITALNLTRQDMFTAAQAQGITLGGPGGGDRGNFTGTPPAGGGPFGGGDFGGAGGPPGGPGGFDQLSPEQQATLQARRDANGDRPRFNNSMPPAFIEALITLLQARAQ